MDCVVKANSHDFRLFTIYQPPPSKKNQLSLPKFWKNWAKLLQSTADTVQDVLILGDLNFHLDDKGNLSTQRFQSYMDEFGQTQLINEPTHNKKHTLDVLIARDESHIIRSFYVTDPGLCNKEAKVTNDHFAIICELHIAKQRPLPKTIKFRDLNSLDITEFAKSLSKSNLLDNRYMETITATHAGELYNKTLQDILDQMAPLKSKEIYPHKNAAWFNSDLQKLKRQKRQAERLWRKTRNEEHRKLYNSRRINSDKKHRELRRSYTSGIIIETGTD